MLSLVHFGAGLHFKQYRSLNWFILCLNSQNRIQHHHSVTGSLRRAASQQNIHHIFPLAYLERLLQLTADSVMESHMDMDSSFLDLSDNDSSGPSASSDDEPLAQFLQKKKRGRPISAKRNMSDASEDDSDKENDLPRHLLKRKRRTLKSPSPKSLKARFCCTLLCLGLVGVFEIQRARQCFQTMSKSQQHQWMLEYFRTHSSADGVGGHKFVYIVGTTTVCFIAWQLIHGISRSTAFRVMKAFKAGKITTSPPNLHRFGAASPSVNHCISWFAEYVDKFADKVPNQARLHLPSCMTKQDVYNCMEVELHELGITVCSQSHFYRVWRKQFRHVVIPAVNRFAKCEKCTLIKSLLEQTMNKDERAMLKARREKHLHRQNTERRKYYKHAQKAKKNPEKYMSIIIDGMDQSKTYLPHFKQESKFISTMQKLKTHVTGVIVHGLGIFGFFDACQWPHSSNLTLNVLLSTLMHYKDNLPPVLYLQMDNCSRENKNRFVFAFCCLLIELKIFTKIKVSFLMVGHTHEDIDQVFSRFSTWLGKHSAVTIPRLMSGFQNCYHPSPKSINLHHLFNISEWIGHHVETITQHSKPHIFRFTLNDNNKAVLYTKKWSTDNTWQSCDSTTPATALLKQCPTSTPKSLPPNFDDIDIHCLEKDLETVRKYMGSPVDHDWWLKWFAEAKQEAPGDELQRWPLAELAKAVENNRKRPPIHHSQASPAMLSVDISDEDDPIPQVTIGKKSTKSTKTCLQPNRPMQIGDLVLTDMIKYADFWPQLGEIVAIEDPSVTIHWYKGSLSGAWTPWMLAARSGRGGREAWLEKIHHSLIWLYGFSLTPKSNIPKSLKDCIIDYYG